MSVLKKLPKIKEPGTAAAFIAVLTSQVGVREGNNNDNPYGRWYRMNFVAWCAILISWAAFKSGCSKIIPRHAFTPAGANWFKAKDQWGTKPKPGAIAYFYNASLGRIAHVEGVVKVYENGDFLSCGGNTNSTGSREGNGVYLQRRTTTRGGGFGYPAYKKSTKAKEKEREIPVDLSNVISRAKKTRKYAGRVAAALIEEGFKPNIRGYKKWQKSLGYSGNDASGIAGKDSLTKLGHKHDFKVKG